MFLIYAQRWKVSSYMMWKVNQRAKVCDIYTFNAHQMIMIWYYVVLFFFENVNTIYTKTLSKVLEVLALEWIEAMEYSFLSSTIIYFLLDSLPLLRPLMLIYFSPFFSCNFLLIITHMRGNQRKKSKQLLESVTKFSLFPKFYESFLFPNGNKINLVFPASIISNSSITYILPTSIHYI